MGLKFNSDRADRRSAEAVEKTVWLGKALFGVACARMKDQILALQGTGPLPRRSQEMCRMRFRESKYLGRVRPAG